MRNMVELLGYDKQLYWHGGDVSNVLINTNTSAIIRVIYLQYKHSRLLHHFTQVVSGY